MFLQPMLQIKIERNSHIPCASYQKWLGEDKCVYETLNDFESVSINSATLVGYLTVIKPRRYSIASAPKGENLSLVVGMMEYKTKTGHYKKGLATGNLNDMEIRCLTCGRKKKDTSTSTEIFRLQRRLARRYSICGSL